MTKSLKLKQRKLQKIIKQSFGSTASHQRKNSLMKDNK